MGELMGAFHKDLAVDMPPGVCYEVAGWTCRPRLSRVLSALSEAIRIAAKDPVWIEDASVRLASRKWHSVAVQVLSNLGWWFGPGGKFFYRRDSYYQAGALSLAWALSTCCLTGFVRLLSPWSP